MIAGLALLAYFVKSWLSQPEVGVRYRPAVLAGTCITAIAFLSYVVIVIAFAIGYDHNSSGDWIPNSAAILSWAPRYMDWSITVPLLMIELIAVSVLTGAVARRARFVGIAAAFLMIVTGHLGGVVIDGGTNMTALWVWGIISGLFMILLYVLIAYIVITSIRSFTPHAATSYRNAMILLMIVWFAYPIAFGIQGFTEGGVRMTTLQVLLSLADIAAKVGFSALIHKVAKLRTAEDLNAGITDHPEPVWISSTQHSAAMSPPVALAPTGMREGQLPTGERKV